MAKQRVDCESDISESDDEECLTYANCEDNQFGEQSNGDAQHNSVRRMRAKRDRRLTATAKMYVCDECQPNRYFEKLKILEKHKTVIHTAISKHICEWCGKKFDTKRQKLIHKRLYGHDKHIEEKKKVSLV